MPPVPDEQNQFLDAYHKAVKAAARRSSADDRFVFLYCTPDDVWRIATEAEWITDVLNANTEGVLIVYSDGRVGIATHNMAEAGSGSS